MIAELIDEISSIRTQLGRGNSPENALPRASYKFRSISGNLDSENDRICTFSVNP